MGCNRSVRDRFNAVMNFQKMSPVPDMEFGYWDETIEIWHRQGLPEELKTRKDVEKYFNLEGIETMPDVPVINGLYPSFEYKIIEDKGETLIVQDGNMNICEVSRAGSSIPRYIKYGLETKEDWRVFKSRLDSENPDRIGEIRNAVGKAHSAGMPVRFDAGSLYGWLRNWMGLENISIAIMADREWVTEMMEHLTELTISLIEKTLPGMNVDSAWWWEDMCYNHGPLVSPDVFEELMVPRYKRITGCLEKYGVKTNILDCDGQIYELVPGWLEAGITCMFPIESAHTDPSKLRDEYGDSILLFGGVDKVQLARGKDAIDRELERLRPLVEKGGYIPCVDHRVPPDVSLENYIYYLEKKKAVLKI